MVKMLEINRQKVPAPFRRSCFCCLLFGVFSDTVAANHEKEIVWEYHNPNIGWVHTLQVLSTNGQPETLVQSQLPQ